MTINRELIKELEYIQKLRFCNCCGNGITPNHKFCFNCGINLKYKDFGNLIFICQKCGAVYRHKPPKKHLCWVCESKMSIIPKILE